MAGEWSLNLWCLPPLLAENTTLLRPASGGFKAKVRRNSGSIGRDFLFLECFPPDGRCVERPPPRPPISGTRGMAWWLSAKSALLERLSGVTDLCQPENIAVARAWRHGLMGQGDGTL
jgi:hypothetical protein